MSKINVIYIAPGEHPVEKEIDDSLESLQQEVEGYIECVYLFDKPNCLIVKEEGKLNGMELNRSLKNDKGEMIDIIAGPFIIVGLKDENFSSFPIEHYQKIMDMFYEPEMFVRMPDGTLKSMPIDLGYGTE